MKLNKEQKETKNALECCVKEECNTCIYYGVTACIGYLLKDALSLINELTEETESVEGASD